MTSRPSATVVAPIGSESGSESQRRDNDHAANDPDVHVSLLAGLDPSARAYALALVARAVIGGTRVVITDDRDACEAVCRTIDALLAAEAAR